MTSNWIQLLFWCHRLPERSFHYKGKPFPICARCTGILIGYGVGILISCLAIQLPLGILALMGIPLILDGGIQYLSSYESHNGRRCWTGVLFGTALIQFFYWTTCIAWEIGKNLTF